MTDSISTALMKAISGSGQLDVQALLRSHLETQVQSNPQLMQVLQLFEQRQAQLGESQDEDLLTSEDEVYSVEGSPLENDAEQRVQHVQELEEILSKVYAELEVLRARNDALAAALGACSLCFGDDPLCDRCFGRGMPGSLPPKPKAFRKYVLPAFRRAEVIENGGGESAKRTQKIADQEVNPGIGTKKR